MSNHEIDRRNGHENDGGYVLRARVDVNALVMDAARRLRRTAGPHIEIDEDLDLSLGAARGNPVELEYAIEDLAANGCDAMPEGGTLTIRTRSETIGDRAYITVEVSDSGPDVVRARLETSWIKEIARRNSGMLTAEAHFRRGMTFRLHVPCADPDPAPRREWPQQQNAASAA